MVDDIKSELGNRRKENGVVRPGEMGSRAIVVVGWSYVSSYRAKCSNCFLKSSL